MKSLFQPLNALLSKFGRLLSEPFFAFPKAEDHRRAVVVSAFLLVSAIAVGIEQTMAGNTPLVSLGLLIAGYFLARTRWYKLAAVLLLLALTLPSYLILWQEGILDGNQAISVISWAVIPLIICSLIFSVRITTWLGLTNLLALLALPVLKPNLHMNLLSGALGFYGLAYVILIVVMSQRDQLEGDRQQEMLDSQKKLLQETQAKQHFSEQADMRTRELSMVNNVSAAISNLQSLDSILRLIFEQISRYIHLDIFFIALLDKKTSQVTFPVMYDGGQFWEEPPREISKAISVARVVETGQAFFWNRTQTEMEEARNSPNRVGDPSRIAASIIVIPLQTLQRRIGALSVQSYQLQAYTREHLSILTALAQQVTVAIENARLFEETNLRARRLQILNEIGRDLATLRDLPALIKVVFEQIKQILPSDLIYLGLYDAAKNEMSFPLMYDNGRVWEEPARQVTESSFSFRAIQTREPFLINDWAATQASASPPRTIVGDQTKTTASLIMSPIIFRDQVIGVLSTQSYQPNVFTTEDLDLLSGIANQVGIAIENTKLLEETRHNGQQLSLLYEVSRAVAELKSLPELLEIVYQQARKCLPLDLFYVGLYSPETHEIAFPITYDDGVRYEAEAGPVSEHSFLARFLRGEKPILINRTPAELAARSNGQFQTLGNPTKLSASFLVAPLAIGQRIIGIISAQSYSINAYTPADLELLVRIAHQVSIAIENSRLYDAAQLEIAERQRIAEQLRAAEAKYRDLIEHSPAVIYSSETGADGNWFYVSPQIQTLLGYTPEEWLADPNLWYALIHPEDREQTIASEQKALADNTRVDMDYRIYTRDGRLIWVHDESLNISHASENSKHVVQGILTDITLRKEAELNLKESENRYHSLFLTAERQAQELALLGEVQLALASELELDELLRTVVEAINNSFGYTFVSLYILKGDQLHLHHQVGYAPENVIAVITAHEGVSGKVIQSGLPALIRDVGQEPDFLRADPRIDSEICIPLFNGDKIFGTLNVESARGYQLNESDLHMMMLVSDQVNIALRRASLYDERAENLRREQHINEFAHAISSTLDLPDILKRVAELSVRLVGADTATVSIMSDDGQKQTNVYNYNELTELEVTLPKGYGLTWLAYNTGKPIILDEYSSHPNALPEWSHSGLHAFMAFPIISAEHRLGALALFNRTPVKKFSQRDAQMIEAIAGEVAVAIENARLFEALQKELDERRRVEREREAMYHDLEAKNAELERFTYTVSHDLKSPLVTIGGFLGFLEDDIRKGESERIQRTILRIQEAAIKMRRLLDELLELSRVGRLANPSVKVSMSELAEEAVELAQGQLVARQVEVQVEAGMPIVFVDRVRMVEVLQNLIVNATKFMGGQAQPLITIGVQEIHGKPAFFVRDNGVGIAPEYHTKVFGLFDKLDPNSEGTGIGLALVKRIVEVHGGTIWVESELGRGATFLFTLHEKNIEETT